MTNNTKWTLWRQDDNGSAAVIATSLTKEAAEARMAELEARGHKQHYWIEEERSQTLPALNLVVIRSRDIEATRSFYERIGLPFSLHKHGKGDAHYASEGSSIVFEIYPEKNLPSDTQTRIGFSVPCVGTTIESLRQSGHEIMSEPTESPWGLRAVVRDPDGRAVELTTPSSK